MPRKVYATEEERKQAQREKQRRYREAHKEEIKEANRRWYEEHKEEQQRSARLRGRKKWGHTSYNEELADEDRVEISSAEDFVRQAMDNVQPSERYQEFTALLAEHGIEDVDVIDKIYRAATAARSDSNTKRGVEFEKVIQKLLLNQLKDTSLYLYRQVPFNGHRCLIDFVVTEEKAMKDDLDLSKAIIVSTKTGFSTTWREDMHLYSHCKAYFMVTLNGVIPTETLAPNVYFVTPNIAEDTDHVINVNSLAAKIIELSGTS